MDASRYRRTRPGDSRSRELSNSCSIARRDSARFEREISKDRFEGPARLPKFSNISRDRRITASDRFSSPWKIRRVAGERYRRWRPAINRGNIIRASLERCRCFYRERRREKVGQLPIRGRLLSASMAALNETRILIDAD